MWSKLFLCIQNIFLQADKSTLDVRLEIFMYKVKIASLWIDGKNCNELKTLTIPITSVIKLCNGYQKRM